MLESMAVDFLCKGSVIICLLIRGLYERVDGCLFLFFLTVKFGMGVKIPKDLGKTKRPCRALIFLVVFQLYKILTGAVKTIFFPFKKQDPSKRT